MGQEEEKKKLIVLTGPTASGKTALSVRLAEKIGGEIISADSMQVYRGMDIGSAKIRPDEMRGVPHHLIDVLDPDEPFDAALFQHLAKKAMDGIWSRGHIPILAGGTGFYIQGVVYDIDFTENDGDMSLRRELEAIGREASGKERLHEMLRRWIRMRQSRFIQTMSNAQSGPLSTISRPGRRCQPTTGRSGAGHLPISSYILSSRTSGRFSTAALISVWRK